MVKTPLFWYSIHKLRKKPNFLSKQFIRRFLIKPKENYGDLLSKYLVEKISQNKTKWYRPNQSVKPNYFVIGSILNYSDKQTIVWGSGIIQKRELVGAQDFRAVRGPLTRKRLIELGKDCPKIYGDPAILLPLLFNPTVQKKYKLGIIPHYIDYEKVIALFDNENIKIINLLTLNIEQTTRDILECEHIISSSLHGMIVAHSYGIKSIWVKFGENLYGDNIKFDDYLLSVNLVPYPETLLESKLSIDELFDLFTNKSVLPDKNTLWELRQGLINSIPFPYKKEFLNNLPIN
jgi:pyruvyltransferase